MIALVTGGAGFIGTHLVEALLAKRYDVHVVDNLTTGVEDNLAHLRTNPRLRVTVDSILNDGVMERAVAEADVVFHLAAAVGVKWVLGNPLASLETNIRGTDVILAAADRHRGRC